MEMGPLAGMEMAGKESNKMKTKSTTRNAGSREDHFFTQRADKGHLKATCCQWLGGPIRWTGKGCR